MSYNYSHYEDDEGRNLGYITHYEQLPPYGYSNSYIPPSSTNYSGTNYSSVPMSYSNSGSSMTSHGSHGSHGSHNSHNSYNTYPSSPDEYSSSTQTIHPGAATNSYPPIDISYNPPVNTSTKGSSSHKSRASSNSATTTKPPGILLCLHANCEYQTKRQYDLDRHQKTHFPSNPSEKFDCTGRGCGRTGEYGFDRKDHLREHLRKVHAKDIPKQNRRSSKSPTQGRR